MNMRLYHERFWHERQRAARRRAARRLAIAVLGGVIALLVAWPFALGCGR
jgi:hypothetical protein